MERVGADLDSRPRDVLTALERGAETSDAIAAALELDRAQATPALAALEARQLAQGSGTGTSPRRPCRICAMSTVPPFRSDWKRKRWVKLSRSGSSVPVWRLKRWNLECPERVCTSVCPVPVFFPLVTNTRLGFGGRRTPKSSHQFRWESCFDIDFLIELSRMSFLKPDSPE